jgi:hypothetical protein
MPDLPTSLLSRIYAKTAQGQQEIQSRALGLTPLARRVLVLVDGHRSGKDLAAFVPGNDIEVHLTELLTRECIAAVGTAAAPAPASAPAAAAASHPHDPFEDDLVRLPAADTRDAKELEMARNFMTNTVNNIFGHHNRISLLESIHACQSSEALRKVYPAWAHALETNSTGKKRLPELRDKLFAVL